jgi:hypothetical protein
MTVFMELIYFLFFKSLFHLTSIFYLLLILLDSDKSIGNKITNFFKKHYLFKHFYIGMFILSFINYIMIRFLNMDDIKPLHIFCIMNGWMIRRTVICIIDLFSEK